MSSHYASLTDQQLADKLAEIVGAIEDIAMGKAVRSVWGEDRRLEYDTGNGVGRIRALERLQRALEAEIGRRAGTDPEGAIGVMFP